MTSTESHHPQSRERNSAVPGEVRLSESDEFHKKSFGLTHYYTDKWGAYTRHLDPAQHTTSKRYTQKNRAQAFDAADTHQTLGAQDHLLLKVNTDA